MVGEDLIGGVDEVDHPPEPGVGHSVVDDLLDLCWCDSDGQGGAKHDPVLGQRPRCDQSGKLDH